MDNPQITPFKFPTEFFTLFHQLYSKNAEEQIVAVQKVRGYLTKGAIPHSIEITALLVDAKLSDVPGCDISVRLKYSTCMVKFVNGLLDPFQQSLYNISLHRLAQDLKLPGYFVELRHACTHERMPSLQMLRMMSTRALQWIKDQYWDVVLAEYKNRGMLQMDGRAWRSMLVNARKSWLKVSGVTTNEDYKKVEEVLKKIKKIRKAEIQEKQKDKSLNVLINSLKCDDVLMHCLIFRNILILNKELSEKHINGMKMMWIPILETFERSYLFQLWEKLFLLSTQKVLATHTDSDVNIKYFQNENEVLQAKEWVVAILKMKILNKENINKFMELIAIDSDSSVLCMKLLKDEYPKLILEAKIQERVDKLEHIMQKFWVLDNTFKKRKREGNDDCNSDENDSNDNKPKIALFQTYSHWRPVPFGCIPPS